MKIKYIENEVNNGIAYDWKAIVKEYRKLGVPPEYDYSGILPLYDDILKWFVLCSERSVGKTTTILLIGMVMYKLYGTIIQHVRHNDREQKASYYQRLFDTIVNYKNGQYIERLTDGMYNSIVYFHKAFYYGKTDGDKTIRAEKPFMIALAASDCYQLCSTYEAPKGDIILLDECFNDKNTPEEFIRFNHLLKTILRERLSAKIFILGNNIDVNNIWFRQLTIHNHVRKMKRGDSKVVYTADGMPIYVSFLENRAPEKRKRFNKLYYGFGNSELNSITGDGEWKIKEYPSVTLLNNKENLLRGLYISYHDDIYMEIELVNSDSGIYYFVHPANMYSAIKGDLLYVMRTPSKPNELFFGRDNLIDKIMLALRNNRVVYSDNETGNLFEKFIKETE